MGYCASLGLRFRLRGQEFPGLSAVLGLLAVKKSRSKSEKFQACTSQSFHSSGWQLQPIPLLQYCAAPRPKEEPSTHAVAANAKQRHSARQAARCGRERQA